MPQAIDCVTELDAGGNAVTTIQQAAAEIVALINGRPTSATQAQIEAILARFATAAAEKPKAGCISSPLLARIIDAMAGHRAADRIAGRLLGDDFPAAEAEVERWNDLIEELEAEIPNPPQSDGDVIIRAVLARHFADEDRSGLMRALNDGDVCDMRAARLIEAVLQSYGLDPTKIDAGLLNARQQGEAVQ